MASIGYGKLRCKHAKCTRVRPYWHDFCKQHRETQSGDVVTVIETRQEFNAAYDRGYYDGSRGFSQGVYYQDAGLQKAYDTGKQEGIHARDMPRKYRQWDNVIMDSDDANSRR